MLKVRNTKMLLTVAAMITLGGCSWFESKPATPAAPIAETPAGSGNQLVDMTPATTPAKQEGTPHIGDVPEKIAPTAPIGGEAYYLVVGAYAVANGKSENAAVAAKYLTDHGIPATVVLPTGANKFANVVTVEGFATMKEGDALHKKVIEVGKKYPKGPAFSDAYFKKMKK